MRVEELSGPAAAVHPAVADREGTLELGTVEVEAAPRLSQPFAVRGVPTLMVLRGDEVLARHAGAAPESILPSWVDSVLSGSGES